MTKPLRPFHLAFPIYNISSTINWYQNTLGCKIGRQDKKWVDFDFFGHQISGHLANKNNIILIFPGIKHINRQFIIYFH